MIDTVFWVIAVAVMIAMAVAAGAFRRAPPAPRAPADDRLDRESVAALLDVLTRQQRRLERPIDALRRIVEERDQYSLAAGELVELLAPLSQRGDGSWPGTLRRLLVERAALLSIARAKGAES